MALLIFVVTLLLVIFRPKGLGIGWGAGIGAALTLLFGLATAADVRQIWDMIWNATVTLIGIILITRILDQAGTFRWAALHTAKLAAGNGRRAFVYVILFGAVVAMFFTNDGSVLVVTPVVWEMTRALGFSRRSTLAYLFACGFVADAFSTPLVVSNLVNILHADFFNLSFTEYARVMWLPSLAVLIATLVVLYAYFRRDVTPSFEVERLQAPSTAIQDRSLFHLGFWVMGVVILTFFTDGLWPVREAIVVMLGALVLVGKARRSPHVDLMRTVREAPWDVIGFSLGMYVVVFGLRSAGITDVMASLWNAASASESIGAIIFLKGIGSAVLASVMNNLPGTVTGMLVVEAAALPDRLQSAMVYANVLGNDIGPKLTPIGSLGTLLWLHELKRRGVPMSWGEYLRVGIIITPPVLLAALFGLWLVMRG